MENLPQNLFDNDAYLKINTDVAKAMVDPYEHYIKHGINEGRTGGLDYEKLSLAQLKHFYYNALPESDAECELSKKLWSVPFYLKNRFVFHFSLLEYYGRKCKNITEFGVGEGHSTIAFLFCEAKLTSYDTEESKFTKWLKYKNISNWDFKKTLDTIEETELVFFSNYTLYEVLKDEILEKVSKYIIFYNFPKTLTLPNLKNFKLDYQTEECNGLSVFEKIQPKIDALPSNAI